MGEDHTVTKITIDWKSKEWRDLSYNQALIAKMQSSANHFF